MQTKETQSTHLEANSYRIEISQETTLRASGEP